MFNIYFVNFSVINSRSSWSSLIEAIKRNWNLFPRSIAYIYMAFRTFSTWVNFIMVSKYKQLIIVFIVISQAKAFENNEFCQKMAIKHCTAHLRDIFQDLEEKRWNSERCSEFQVMMERKWSFLLLCFLASRNICYTDQKRIVLPFVFFFP